MKGRHSNFNVHVLYYITPPRYSLNLSTRPEKYMGDAATWDVAEARLREALDGTGERWSVDEGGGAFYGPKIDVR